MLKVFDVFGGCILSCVLALTMFVPFSVAYSKSTETVLYAFQDKADGSSPTAGLIIDSAGNLYGTTQSGGHCAGGTAFELAPDGTETKLHCFRGSDGQLPSAGMIMDNRGKLYGPTTDGGTNEKGTVFEIGRHHNETILYSFCAQINCADGAYPSGSLISDKEENLYGATAAGGTNNNGTVFKLAADGIETVLHSFAGGIDGSLPCGALMADKAGNLFGVTQYGGTDDDGTVFEVAPDGSETVLYSFAGGTDGLSPCGALIADKVGNLYGTTYEGGTNGKGTVFELAPDGTETVLYSFCSRADCADGSQPSTGVISDRKGNLHGTTWFGGKGAGCGSTACGVVFRLAPNGVETVLHAFAGGSDGALPEAGLISDSVGNLYGTTVSGGGACQFEVGCGTVFEITK